MLTNDVVKVKHAEDKQEGTEHWAPGDTVGQWSSRGGTVVNIDKLLFICEL